MTEIEGIVQDIFRKVLSQPNLELKPHLTAKDVTGWDSLSNIELMVSIENKFKVRFTSAELLDLENVGALIDLVSKKHTKV